MKQVFLTFSNQSEFQEKLPFAFNENNEVICAGRGFNIDVVGEIYQNNAEFDELGELMKPATKLSGFHVNALVDDAFYKQLPKANIVKPKTPARIFAVN